MNGRTTDPRQVVRAWVRRMVNDGDLAAAEELFGPDLAGWARTWVAGFRTAFPDVSMRTHELVVEGDRVVGRFHCSGTHLGPWQGRPPSGRRFAGIDEVYFFTVTDGQITDMWGVEDNLERFAQLGLSVPRAGEEPS